MTTHTHVASCPRITHHVITFLMKLNSDLAGEAVRMEGQLARPHDQSGSRDWLEAASALTSCKHPEQKEKPKRCEELLLRGNFTLNSEESRSGPAVVLLAVDVPVSPVKRGVRLQLAVTLAAAEADAVPHPARSQ